MSQGDCSSGAGRNDEDAASTLRGLVKINLRFFSLLARCSFPVTVEFVGRGKILSLSQATPLFCPTKHQPSTSSLAASFAANQSKWPSIHSLIHCANVAATVYVAAFSGSTYISCKRKQLGCSKVDPVTVLIIIIIIVIMTTIVV